MKLDDRPVIDQLLNPTPLNLLHEVAGEMHDHVRDSFDKVQESIDGHLFPLLDLIPEDDRDAGHDRIAAVGGALCDEDERRSTELLWEFAERLEARL